MHKILEKRERALGTKLFLKGERCSSAKCAAVKRPYRPGEHSKTKRFRKSSEYGRQLGEKQKIRFSYGLKEKELEKYFVLADKSGEPTDTALIELLESRLDNVVFRLGFVSSRRIARQLVSHGHIMVNNRRVTVPSISLKAADEVSFRKESADHSLLKDLAGRLKNYQTPVWLKLDKEKLVGEVLSKPKDVEMPFDLNLVVNYYSK
jgi:small subunit ribosomal protein S4